MNNFYIIDTKNYQFLTINEVDYTDDINSAGLFNEDVAEIICNKNSDLMKRHKTRFAEALKTAYFHARVNLIDFEAKQEHDATVADEIKLIRYELDFTQSELAEKLGVKKNTVAVYETGRANPSTKFLMKLRGLVKRKA